VPKLAGFVPYSLFHKARFLNSPLNGRVDKTLLHQNEVNRQPRVFGGTADPWGGSPWSRFSTEQNVSYVTGTWGRVGKADIVSKCSLLKLFRGGIYLLRKPLSISGCYICKII
jgi:hypothetical protein